MPLLKKEAMLGDRIWSLIIHALRYGFSDTLYHAGLYNAAVSTIADCLGNSVTTTCYTNPASLAKVKAEIAHYSIFNGGLKTSPRLPVSNGFQQI